MTLPDLDKLFKEREMPVPLGTASHVSMTSDPNVTFIDTGASENTIALLHVHIGGAVG